MHVPHMSGLDLNLALVLHALLAERSVSRAAKRLGLSQSATSHALARLRLSLDDPLFSRVPRGIVPTARAEALAEPLARGLALLEQSLVAPPRFEPATTARHFRIAATDYVEFVMLPRLLGELARTAPLLELSVRPYADAAIEDLQRGDLDLLLGLLRPQPGSGVQVQELISERLVCVVRRGHALTRGRLTLQRFAAAGHVLIAPRGRPGGPVDTALAERGLARRIAVAVPHFLAAPHIVAETDLVLTVAERVATSFASVLPLNILELPFELPLIRGTMLWHERHTGDPAHAWLRERLIQIAAQARAPRAWKRRSPHARR
ncbi:MAG TPA: LysR family transcriptional regulator [Polyangiaceae bacterium]|nr:LysR family transcriptional regulator [Polyangiaceae bacterium]